MSIRAMMAENQAYIESVHNELPNCPKCGSDYVTFDMLSDGVYYAKCFHSPCDYTVENRLPHLVLQEWNKDRAPNANRTSPEVGE